MANTSRLALLVALVAGCTSTKTIQPSTEPISVTSSSAAATPDLRIEPSDEAWLIRTASATAPIRYRESSRSSVVTFVGSVEVEIGGEWVEVMEIDCEPYDDCENLTCLEGTSAIDFSELAELREHLGANFSAMEFVDLIRPELPCSACLNALDGNFGVNVTLFQSGVDMREGDWEEIDRLLRFAEENWRPDPAAGREAISQLRLLTASRGEYESQRLSSEYLIDVHVRQLDGTTPRMAVVDTAGDWLPNGVDLLEFYWAWWNAWSGEETSAPFDALSQSPARALPELPPDLSASLKRVHELLPGSSHHSTYEVPGRAGTAGYLIRVTEDNRGQTAILLPDGRILMVVDESKFGDDSPWVPTRTAPATH